MVYFTTEITYAYRSDKVDKVLGKGVNIILQENVNGLPYGACHSPSSTYLLLQMSPLPNREFSNGSSSEYSLFI